MIDLHTHTIFSDGTWTLEEMLTNAENSNINILAITDHDTALPHIKLKDIDIKKYFSGRVIVGGEFNAIFKNTKIELLGYNFNPVQLQNWIDNTYNKKEEIQEYEELHIRPESEKNAVEEKKTFNLTYLYLAFGVVLGLVFVFAYAIPYMNAVR